MCWDGKLLLCDQRDDQVFMTLGCNIPTTRGFQVVTDERKPVLVENRLRDVKVLRCHVGHTMIIHCPLLSAVLLRKLTNTNSRRCLLLFLR